MILGDRHPITIMEIFPTVTSSVFSELVVILKGRAAYLAHEVKLFETLRTMGSIRPFKLAFLLEDSDYNQGEIRREVAEALDSATRIGLLDFLDSPPTIRIGKSSRPAWDWFDVE